MMPTGVAIARANATINADPTMAWRTPPPVAVDPNVDRPERLRQEINVYRTDPLFGHIDDDQYEGNERQRGRHDR